VKRKFESMKWYLLTLIVRQLLFLVGWSLVAGSTIGSDFPVAFAMVTTSLGAFIASNDGVVLAYRADLTKERGN
jgi:hypothetical protein